MCTASETLVRPNFIIVGGAKCGTTSLYEYLRQHPNVYMSETKEPHYFINVPPGYPWRYTKHEYYSLFSDGEGKKAIGEASTLYLVAPESPGQIKKELGLVKIIILLRNPAKRAYSMWGQLVRRGMEGATSLEEGLALENIRQQDPRFPVTCLQHPLDYRYFHNGLYSNMVRRYFDTFGRDHVFVGVFEELAKDPLAFCRDVFEFLDIDPDFLPAVEVYNPGRIPRSISLQHWVVRLLMGRERYDAFTRGAWLMLRTIPRTLRGRLLLRIREINTRFGYEPAMSRYLYSQLMERYRPDIQNLEALLGRRLEVWYG